MQLPTEKQASSLRKYFIEYTVLALCICVVVLFSLYYNLNTFITKTMMDDKLRMERVIERNTDYLNNFHK